MDISQRAEKIGKLSDHILEAQPAAENDFRATKELMVLMGENLQLQAEQILDVLALCMEMEQAIIVKDQEIERLKALLNQGRHE